MKNTLKKIALIALAAVMVFSFAACGGNTPANNNNAGTNTNNAAEESKFDFSKYPADFSAWKQADLKNYFVEAGLWTNEKFLLMDLSEGDISAMKAEAGTMYLDAEKASCYDMFCYYDTTKAESKAMLDSIIENKAIVVDGNKDNALGIDAVVGNFAMMYLMGTDDAHINGVIDALKAIVEHYNVTGGYINE